MTRSLPKRRARLLVLASSFALTTACVGEVTPRGVWSPDDDSQDEDGDHGDGQSEQGGGDGDSAGDGAGAIGGDGDSIGGDGDDDVPPGEHPQPSNDQHGAAMPYARYDTDQGTAGGGASVQSASSFDQALIASEASGQSYVTLPSPGAFVEWQVREGEGGRGVTMRFTMPDGADGMGLRGSLDVKVNGTKVHTVDLTSYFAWQYFASDHPSDAPGGGAPAFRFDEVHFKLPEALRAGDTIRIEKSAGDGIEYGVDFLEVEPVPEAILQPEGSVSPTDFGAVADDGQDDLAAFDAAVQAAVSGGKLLYIPAGTFHLGSMWQVGSLDAMIQDLRVTGAGIWHTQIQFTSPEKASGGISFRILGKLEFGNLYMNSNLRSRYNQEAVYKAFMDNFGNGSRVHDVWVEHFECGFWVGDYGHQPAIHAENLLIENSRVRNNLADGINFAQGTSHSTVRNTNLRNNGDDALAIWTSDVFGAPPGVNNTFAYDTIEYNWRASGVGIFGGSGHKVHHLKIVDGFGSSGFRMNTVFPGYHFENNTGIEFTDSTIIHGGTSADVYKGERGAIDLEASTGPIKNLAVSRIDILGAQRSGVQMGYGGGFENIVMSDVHIEGAGLDGVTTSRFSSPHPGSAIYTYTGHGSATFRGLTTSEIANPDVNFIQPGFEIVMQ